MSTFWTIFLFIVNFVLGTLIVIACNFVGKWSRKLASTDKEWEKSEAESKISGWLCVLAAIIIIIFTISFGQFGFGLSKELDKMNDRIEALEQQTVTPAVDTLCTKDVLKDE